MSDADTTTLRGSFSAIADAIRAKSGTDDTMTPSQMPERIATIVAASDLPQTVPTPSMQGAVTLSPKMVLRMTGEDVTSFAELFKSNVALTSMYIPAGIGSHVTNASSMFSGCSLLRELAIAPGALPGVKNLGSFLSSCYKLTSLILPDGFGAEATNLNYFLYWAQAMTTVTLPAGFGAAATSISRMFENCPALKTVNLPEGFGRNCTYWGSSFSGCTALTTINGQLCAKCSLALSACPLTHESLINVLNSIQTVTTTQTLTLGTTNLAKLTDEEKAVATEKGWTLA